MPILSFLHQKGGTGKSTLAIALAAGLAQLGNRVLLYDADPQGTAGDWVNRFGSAFQVELHSQVQPVVHREVPQLAQKYDWVVVDSPPSLSTMTESVIQTGGRLIIPVRPAEPDLWALHWLAAVIRKMKRDRHVMDPLIAVNQHQGEDISSLERESLRLGIPLFGRPIPYDAAFGRLFLGEPLPKALNDLVLSLADMLPTAA
ncbi:MAG: AAA family ATPase [Deltaproteobacteria bacterium]|nr:AAA family ATPase [Deltaproteobacteria bacterium]